MRLYSGRETLGYQARASHRVGLFPGLSIRCGLEGWVKSLAGKYVLAALIMVLITAPRVVAWEFHLGGALQYKYEYYSQLGSNGFFGPYDVSNIFFGAPPFEANSNGWLGIETHAGLFQGRHPGIVSGSDASLQTLRVELHPQLTVNKAIRIRGRYRIGGSNVGNDDLQETWSEIGPGFNTEYVNSLVPGRNNPMAYGEWTMLWLTAKTPWGVVSFGKRPFAVGCGLQYSAEDASQESLMLTVPYGPLTFGVGFYPMTLGQVDFFDMPRRTDEAWVEYWLAMDDYYLPSLFWDKGGRPNKYLAFLKYQGGPLEFGAGTQYTSLHFGAEGARYEDDEFPTTDVTDWEGWIYAKYANGRFFFNAEADFFFRSRYGQRTASGDIVVNDGDVYAPINDGGGSIFAPKYIESWRWMVESGIFAGPAKLSVLYAYLPGPDRRHGVLIDRQPTTFFVDPGSLDPTWGWDVREEAVYLNRHVGNLGVFRPYSLLFAYDYGAGLNCYDLNGNGCVTDASVLAARLDYALAANLNLSCSFLWAERASHGWQWGCIWPYERVAVFVPYRNLDNPGLEYADPVPTIPDTALGWEAGFGAQWNLLESMLLSVHGAYWQPGRWFNYACVDRSVQDWGDPTAANNWSVNPDRTIDPIFGLDIRIIADF